MPPADALSVRSPRPMLATGGELPTGAGWAYELKWDGVRALAALPAMPAPPARPALAARPASLRVFARSGAEITAGYPELAALGAALRAADLDDVVLDGEIVALGEDGRPNFMALAERMHVRDAGRTASLSTAIPVTYMIFDLLRLGGTTLTAVPYAQRRELLEELAEGPPLGGSTRWLVPPRFDDGPATLTAARELSLEGVVAKRLDSAYRPGSRSPDWIKVKHEHTGDFVVGGWRPGARALGALLVGAARPDGRLDYRGRVGGGISASAERALLKALAPLHATTSPFADALPREDAKDATYVRPEIVVEVRYGQLTPDAKLRFPRFVRMRPDKAPADTEDQ